MSCWLFSTGLLSLLLSAMTLYPARRLGYFMPIYFFATLLQGELAPWNILLQIPLALWLASSGGLDDNFGVAGLVFYLLSWAGLLFILWRAKGSQQALDNALNEALGKDYLNTITADRQ